MICAAGAVCGQGACVAACLVKLWETWKTHFHQSCTVSGPATGFLSWFVRPPAAVKSEIEYPFGLEKLEPCGVSEGGRGSDPVAARGKARAQIFWEFRKPKYSGPVRNLDEVQRVVEKSVARIRFQQIVAREPGKTSRVSRVPEGTRSIVISKNCSGKSAARRSDDQKVNRAKGPEHVEHPTELCDVE